VIASSRRDKPVGSFGIGRAIERHMKVLEAVGLRRSRFLLDLRARLGGKAEIDDRDEAHLSDFGHGVE
jgi:hypothetical protein